MKTVAELEAENADLRARLARAERMVDRLLSEPPKVEVHREVVKEFVPYPAPAVPMPVPAPAPIVPPWIPSIPPWIPNPWDPMFPRGTILRVQLGECLALDSAMRRERGLPGGHATASS